MTDKNGVKLDANRFHPSKLQLVALSLKNNTINNRNLIDLMTTRKTALRSKDMTSFGIAVAAAEFSKTVSPT